MGLITRFTDPENRHPFFDQLEKLLKNRTGVLGLVLITLFVLAALFAPVLSPHDPIENSLYDQLKPPIWQQGGSSENLLGTDDLGRDILSRIIFGARVSLMVGVVSVGIAVLFGAFPDPPGLVGNGFTRHCHIPGGSGLQPVG
ncbi:MAG TPA: hypothetical protein ENH32_00965 [Proteobacteria bacterium]|nr:dipeptide transport system permease protein DppC [bacterium BMS3Abin14]HDL52525.1 hypothetical protein [Pseudomonadota bacterium]